ITSNTATVGGGGVYTSSPTVTFSHDQINNNIVTGPDHSMDSASANPAIGGSVEGGGIDINGGVVSINFTTIDGNAVRAGAGGNGSSGNSPAPFPTKAITATNGANGADGGEGTKGGSGGQASGGGIAIDHGSLSISASTLSNNIVQ